MAGKPVPRVTDHAVVRYLERVVGLDIDQVRAEILSPVVLRAAVELRTCTVKRAGGVKIVIQDGNIVTVAKD